MKITTQLNMIIQERNQSLIIKSVKPSIYTEYNSNISNKLIVLKNSACNYFIYYFIRFLKKYAKIGPIQACLFELCRGQISNA